MAESMYANNGCGLAAPQIGLSKRMIVIDADDGAGIREYVTPVISEFKGEEIDTEGCLSVDDYEGEVKRAAEVTVRFQDRKGGHWRLTASGLLARALQLVCEDWDVIIFIEWSLCLSPLRK